MNEQEETIDLRVLLKVLTSHILPIVAVTVAAAVIGFVLAKSIVPKKHTSEALMYVENSSETVSESTLPEKHTFSSALTFTAAGGLIGLVLTYGLFLVLELLDTNLKPDDDLTAMSDLPVFAEIIDFAGSSRSGYKYPNYDGYDPTSGSDPTYSEYGRDIDKRAVYRETEVKHGKEK